MQRINSLKLRVITRKMKQTYENEFNGLSYILTKRVTKYVCIMQRLLKSLPGEIVIRQWNF